MPVSFSKFTFVKTIKQLFKMTDTLKISVPPYPHTDKAEPACLFCANFLWQREHPTGIYREHAYFTPLEQLIDTVRTLRLHKRKEGDTILPGDLVVIFRGRKVAENIMHTVIALDGDNWFGAGNRAFLSHVLRKPLDGLQDRDFISTLCLHINKATYTFGPHSFDVWGK